MKTMNLSLNPSIDLILAPMYAGKTSELIRRLIIYYEMDMKVLYVNSAKDNRSEDAFSTHNCTIGKIPFKALKTEDIRTLDVSEYSVIGVDEASFFPGLKDTVLKWVEEQGKIVIVAGLNADYLRRPFGELNDLIPFCDSITKLTPFCLTCKKTEGKITPAHFTKRIIKSREDVLVGGKETYIPVCRKCYLMVEESNSDLDPYESDRPESPGPSGSLSDPIWLGKWFDGMYEIDGVTFYVTVPKTYDPVLPEMVIPDGHSLCDIPEYFQNLDSTRIECVNGVATGFGETMCSYCSTNCEKRIYECHHCGCIMCHLCRLETSEEEAKKNGAENWEGRKEKLLACFAANQLEFREQRLGNIVCDGCNRPIEKLYGLWHTNDQQDFCPECWEKKKSDLDPTEFRELHINREAFQRGIGSLLDWIPIIEDTETGARVMYNMNPDAPLYHRTLLVSVDDHGREGWNLWPGTLEKTLDQIRGKIPEFQKVKEDHGQSWETHYKCPIHLLISSAGRELYLG